MRIRFPCVGIAVTSACTTGPASADGLDTGALDTAILIQPGDAVGRITLDKGDAPVLNARLARAALAGMQH